jgi:hypothetical protein
VVPIRPYEKRDREQIESFVCVPHGQRWRLNAQVVIHEAPGECEEEHVNVLVAAEQENVLGVAVYRQSPKDSTKCEICSIGVVIPRQNQGIGLSLKTALITSVITTTDIREFVSTVHKRNGAMLKINERLEATTEKDPEDGEYWLTLVKARPQVQEGDVAPSK